jgi:hypothetical protein
MALPSTTRQLVFHLPAVLAAIALMIFPIQMLFFVLDKVIHRFSFFVIFVFELVFYTLFWFTTLLPLKFVLW